MNVSVSVVISNYNYGQYLAECVQSVLAQTVQPREIIVVDDGSTDNSMDVVAGFSGKITVIPQANGGQAAALNTGFARVTGDLVLFLDADDTLAPHCVERISARWRAEAAKIHWRLQLIENGRLLPRTFPEAKWPLSDGDVAAQQVETGNIGPPTSGNAFNVEKLKKVMPIPLDFRISADTYLFARTPFLGPFIAVDEVLGMYRLHGNNYHAATADRGVARARKILLHGEKVEDLVRKDAAETGRSLPVGAIYRNYGMLRARLLSHLSGQPGHPVPDDSIGAILGTAAAHIRRPGLATRYRRMQEFVALGAMVPLLVVRRWRGQPAI